MWEIEFMMYDKFQSFFRLVLRNVFERLLMIIVVLFLVDSTVAHETDSLESSDTATQTAYVTTDSFEREVLQSEVPVLVDFTATWCVPCKVVDPIIDSLVEEVADRAKVFKLDIDDSPEIYARYQVNGIPHILFFNNGKLEDRISGVQERDIYIEYLEAMIAGESALAVTIKLLAQDAYRRHFILSRDLDAVRNAIEHVPNLLTNAFENNQTPLSLILNRSSVRQDALIDLTLTYDPKISTNDLVGLGRCEEFEQAAKAEPEVLNRLDPDGNSPLITALSRAHRLEEDCVRTVLNLGPDLTQTSANSRLSRSVILQNDAELLKEFLARGWDPEWRDSIGNNALHWAALYGYLSSVQVLVEHGVDISVENADGETPGAIVRRARDGRLNMLEQSKVEMDAETRQSIQASIKQFDELLALLESGTAGRELN